MPNRQDISKSRPDFQNASALLISGQTAVKGKVIVMVIFAPEYKGGMTDRRLINCEKVNSVWQVEITKGEMFVCCAGVCGLLTGRNRLRKSAVSHGKPYSTPGQAWRMSGRRPSAAKAEFIA